jgi:alkaline phosphatase
MKRLICILFSVFFVLSVSAELKYIFYFIGDGMGDNQVLSAEMYRAALEGRPCGRVQTIMTSFPYSGQASTYSKSHGITDSAAAGTCLATGKKTKNGMLGMNPDTLPVTTIAEELKHNGWGVGIMTTVAIDHATPGAFYAHVPNRHSYYTIGEQLVKSEFDFFGGAGFHHPQGKHDDEPVNLYRLAEEAGYTIAHGYKEALLFMQEHTPADHQKLILVQATDDQGAKHGDNLPYAIDRRPGDLTLAQIVNTAIPDLDARYDRFFMMVEGGMIDYACHADDAAAAIGELWDMDEALQAALHFYKQHPDETLILVTADHETGGMALGNGDKGLRLDLLQYQRCSAWILSDRFARLFKDKKKPTWAEVEAIYRDNLGFWDKIEITAQEEKALKELYKKTCKGMAADTKTLYKSINKLSDAGIELLNKKAHVGWTTHSHSAHAVPIFAIGVGAEQFSGWHDNTHIVPLLRRALKQ